VSAVALLVYCLGICVLFYANSGGVRTSAGLWVPTVWLLLAGSRMPSAWFASQSMPGVSAGQSYLDGSPFERNIYSVILVVAAIVIAQRGSNVGRILRANGPMVAFILYCAISLVWSGHPDVGFKRWTKLVGDLAMALIILTEQDPTAAIERVLTRIGFIIVPFSILLINHFPALGRVYDNTGTKVGYTGVTTDKNALGMICMLIGLGFIWRLLREWKERKVSHQNGPLFASGVILLGATYLIFKADSATSKSCFLLCGGVIVAIMLFKKAPKPGMIHFLVTGAVGVAVFALFFAGSLLESVGRDSSLTGRTELWTVVLSQPVNRLLGAGYESFWLGDRLATIWRITGQRAVQSHDGYIELLVNLGWAGISVFAILVISSYGRLVKNVRRDPQRACVALAFFAAALIYNFTEAGFKMTYPVWIFFVWAVLSPAAKLKSAVQAEPVVGPLIESQWLVESSADQVWGQPQVR
jgi:exopolysaccharide production protein ExoQ